MIREILDEISVRGLLLNERDFTDEQRSAKWLGNPPASIEAIEKAQAEFKVEFPADYIEFLQTCNGFPACMNIDMSFLPVEKIDYLINVDDFLVEVWTGNEALADVGQALSESILVGGFQEEQYFLLIPPGESHNKWRYWKFASWIPGEQEFEYLTAYFEDVLSFLREQTEGLESPKAKYVVDYSLRDHIYLHDWENVLNTALNFLQKNVLYYYYYHYHLADLLLSLAPELGREKELPGIFQEVSNHYHDDKTIVYVMEKAQNAILVGKNQLPEIHADEFVPGAKNNTLQSLEEQINQYVPHLQMVKFATDKVDYQLHFLFDAGNSKEFLELYEKNAHLNLLNGHYRAAIIYAVLNKREEAQAALRKHFEFAGSREPLKPFFHSVLKTIMDKDFSLKMHEVLKQHD